MQMTDFRITTFHRTAQHLSGVDDCLSSQTLPLFDVVGA